MDKNSNPVSRWGRDPFAGVTAGKSRADAPGVDRESNVGGAAKNPGQEAHRPSDRDSLNGGAASEKWTKWWRGQNNDPPVIKDQEEGIVYRDHDMSRVPIPHISQMVRWFWSKE